MSEPYDLAKCIEVPPERLACGRHREPFRAQWPKGWVIFAVKGMHILLMRQDFADEWRRIQEQNPGMPYKEAIEKALDGFPMCERLGQKELLELYAESGVGVTKVCQACWQTALGTPYAITDPATRKVKQYRHICFNCVVNRMREA